ncbi:hypothetical protein [Candidatus Thiosymbion oneisti]|uniref:hypothetical protein n=1 Tax=Candidatus Thiosymbion oneisti TaxID=589554 RepID=UPI00159F31D2|nr:hypothetical protein [Candidatus Thiosymbion oneisti]
MNANQRKWIKYRPFRVYSRSSAVEIGTAQVRIEYGKNDPVASIYPQITQIFAG